MSGGAMERRWLAAAMASVAVHGAVALAAVGLYSAAVAPVGPPPLSVEIVSFDPVRPIAAPAIRPSAAVPVRAALEKSTPDTGSTPPAPPAVADAAAAPPAANPPVAASEKPPPGPSAAPPPAEARPAAPVIAAPVPRPRPPLPGRAAKALAAQAEPSAAVKPRIDPVPLPLAAKAAPLSAAGASSPASRPLPQSARRPGNDVPHDSAARPAAGNSPPAYPRAARRRGLQGRLVLRVRVGADGAARDVRVIESSGHRLLDASARKTVAGWRFAPARRAGTPVTSRIDIPVSFRLRR